MVARRVEYVQYLDPPGTDEAIVDHVVPRGKLPHAGAVLIRHNTRPRLARERDDRLHNGCDDLEGDIRASVLYQIVGNLLEIPLGGTREPIIEPHRIFGRLARFLTE